MNCYQCQAQLGVRFSTLWEPGIEFCETCFDALPTDAAGFRALLLMLDKQNELAQQRQQRALTREQAIEAWIFYG